jgi:hypothetical protein
MDLGWSKEDSGDQRVKCSTERRVRVVLRREVLSTCFVTVTITPETHTIIHAMGWGPLGSFLINQFTYTNYKFRYNEEGLITGV